MKEQEWEQAMTQRRKAISVAPHWEHRVGRTLYDYWVAPSNPESELGAEWQDKPHRLLYDLIAEIERLHGLPRLERE